MTKTAVLLVVTSALLLQTGCTPAPQSSFEVVSPTREFNAVVETFDNGGLVSSGMNITYVYLHRGLSPRLPVLILTGGPPRIAVPAPKWINPTYLVIFYDDQQTVLFQASQFNGVRIAVRTFGPGRMASNHLPQVPRARVIPAS